MNFDRFKPDGTGKFSPLLYRWLTSKKANERRYMQVFQKRNIIDGDDFRDYWVPNEIVIGRGDSDGFISGRTLGSIIRGDRGVHGSTFAYGPQFKMREITDRFWEEYGRSGRWAWDLLHRMAMVDDKQRFTFSDDCLTRTCNWCGKVHNGTKRVRVERHRYIEWAAA